MSLSSSHHPQHDGQTEVVNRFLKVMIRAFTANHKETWALWPPLLEWARFNERDAEFSNVQF